MWRDSNYRPLIVDNIDTFCMDNSDTFFMTKETSEIRSDKRKQREDKQTDRQISVVFSFNPKSSGQKFENEENKRFVIFVSN